MEVIFVGLLGENLTKRKEERERARDRQIKIMESTINTFEAFNVDDVFVETMEKKLCSDA